MSRILTSVSSPRTTLAKITLGFSYALDDAPYHLIATDFGDADGTSSTLWNDMMIPVSELSSATVQVVTSGTDWPAVVAAISGGVVGLAGLLTSWRQSTKRINAEGDRVKLAEKRRVYAQCLTAFNSALSATIRAEQLPSGVVKSDQKQILQASISGYGAASNAVFEVQLIGSDEVSQLAFRLLGIIGHPNSKDGWTTEYALVNALLIAAMRADLADSEVQLPDAASVAALVEELPHRQPDN